MKSSQKQSDENHDFADELELQLILMLRALPSSITIARHRRTGHYLWSWQNNVGEADSFTQALQEVLILLTRSHTALRSELFHEPDS